MRFMLPLEKAAALEQRGWKDFLQPAAKKAPEMLSLFSSTAPVALPKPAGAKEDAKRILGRAANTHRLLIQPTPTYT